MQPWDAYAAKAANRPTRLKGNTFAEKDYIKSIPGAKWNAAQKAWEVPHEAFDGDEGEARRNRLTESGVSFYSLRKSPFDPGSAADSYFRKWGAVVRY